MPLSSLVFGMHAKVTEPGGTIVPTLRYHDVGAAIEWLCNAFGFDKHLVVGGDDGAVRYAELTYGSGMIMLGPVEDSGVDRLMTQPSDTGGAETQVCYLFVADAAAHCARAKAAGAEIVLDIEDADSNGRGYSCRDPEGHLWNFGTYDPWRRRSASADAPRRRSAGLRGGLRRMAVAAAMSIALVAAAMVGGWLLGVTDGVYLDLSTAAPTSAAEAAASPQQDGPAAERGSRDFKEQLARERAGREAAERLARSAGEQLGQERSAKESAQRTVREAQAQLAREQSAREGAERAAKEAAGHPARADGERLLEELRQQLANERRALEAAQRVAQEARERLSLAERASEAVQEQLAAERSVREAAELAVQQVRQQLAKEQGAKDAAERAAKEAREQEARDRVAKKGPAPRRYMQAAPSGGKPFITWDQ